MGEPVALSASSGLDQQRSARARRILSRVAARGLGLALFYVLILSSLSLATPAFLTYPNAINILSNVSVIGIVAVGQALAIIAGGFDLSVSGVVPLGCVLFAVVVNAGAPLPVALLVVVAVGMIIGLLNGLVVTKAGINPLIATLGMLSVAAGLSQVIAGGITIPITNRAAGALAHASIGSIPNHVLALILVSVTAFVVLRFTTFGRSVYAIGGNREAARLAGLRVDAITGSVYVICAALASFAGAVIGSQLLAGSGNVGGESALASIASVVLGGAALTGGVGGVPGTLIGVLILGTLSNGFALLQVPAFYQQMATGVILLLAVGISRLRMAIR